MDHRREPCAHGGDGTVRPARKRDLTPALVRPHAAIRKPERQLERRVADRPGERIAHASGLDSVELDDEIADRASCLPHDDQSDQRCQSRDERPRRLEPGDRREHREAICQHGVARNPGRARDEGGREDNRPDRPSSRPAGSRVRAIEEEEPDRKDRHDEYEPPMIPVLERNGRLCVDVDQRRNARRRADRAFAQIEEEHVVDVLDRLGCVAEDEDEDPSESAWE